MGLRGPGVGGESAASPRGQAGRVASLAGACLVTALVLGIAAPVAVRSLAARPVAAAGAVVPNGDLSTIGGSGGDGPATAVAQDPSGVSAGPGGGLLVTDSAADAVRLISRAGVESMIAGTNLASYNGDGRPATSASLDSPTASVMEGSDILVADTYSNRIRLVAGSDCSTSCPFGLATKAGLIYTVAGDGVAGYSGDAGRATAAELNAPEGLAVDSRGDLLISDTYNDRVRLVAARSCASGCPYGLPTLTTGDIYTVAGVGIYGFLGNGTPAADAELAAPGGLAVDHSGDIVVADSGNNRVRLVAYGSCSANCQFGLSSLIAGDIYTLAGNGTAGQVGGKLGEGDGGSFTEFDAPAGVAVDRAGDVVVADTLDNLVRLVALASCSSGCAFGLASTVAGHVYAVAGGGTAGYGGDRGPALSAQLRSPRDVYVDGADNLLIADSGNDRVRLVAAGSCTSGCPYGARSTTAGDVYTVAGDGAVGFSGDAGQAGQAELSSPAGVAVDGAGNVLVADTGNDRVRVVAASGCSERCPYGLRRVAAGDVYTVAGNGDAGHGGDGGPAVRASLDGPMAVVAAAGGGLAIADTSNARIRLVASANCASDCPYGLHSTRAGDIYTIAGDGVEGYSGDGGRATSAALDMPTALAVGPSGDLLVADTGNNRIRLVADVTCHSGCPYGLVSTVAGDIYTVAGDGVLGFAGDGHSARVAELAQPGGLAVGISGELIVSDSLNNRIRLVAASSCSSGCPFGLRSTVRGDIYTIAGDGHFGYGGDNGPATSAVLADPEGVAVDAAGNLYVADTDNDRIRVVSDERCYADCRFGVRSMWPGSIASVIGNGNLAVSPNGEPASGLSLAAPTAIAVEPDGQLVVLESADGAIRRLSPEPTDGFVIATSAGAVYSYGAPSDGSAAGERLPAPIIGIAANPAGGGYWLVGLDGSVYPFGGAHFYGSMGGRHLNKPIVAISPTADGGGYWLVASDGGIFAFGDARFYGSMGGRHLNKPIVGMATSPNGSGYWLVATDGGIFTFGSARFRGSMGGSHLNRPVFAMASTPDGGGYWMVASDGGIFTFGNARFHGSLGGFRLKSSIVGMAADPYTGGYRLADADGRVYPFAAPGYGGAVTATTHPLVAIADSD